MAPPRKLGYATGSRKRSPCRSEWFRFAQLLYCFAAYPIETAL